MGKILAIKGHPTRGNEVIEILGMLCGKHPYVKNIGIAKCDIKTDCYYLCDYGFISWCYIGPDEIDDFIIFTLEEFLEKFPYKVGDKVKLYYQDEEEDRYCSNFPSTIIGMRWDKSRGEVAYKMKGIERECYKDEISYDNKDNSNEPDAVITDINLNRTDYADEVEIKLGNYEIEVRDGKTFAVLKKSKYPKTYEACRYVLGLNPMDNDACGYEADLIIRFQELFIARNAYWEIYGEEMGLGKPWEPDLENEELYCIQNYNKQIVIGRTNTAFNKFLVFPTEEIRDTFYENFKGLIEACKEFL